MAINYSAVSIPAYYLWFCYVYVSFHYHLSRFCCSFFRSCSWNSYSINCKFVLLRHTIFLTCFITIYQSECWSDFRLVCQTIFFLMSISLTEASCSMYMIIERIRIYDVICCAIGMCAQFIFFFIISSTGQWVFVWIFCKALYTNYYLDRNLVV